MPRGDGTGPMGMGPMTGRGAGYCGGRGVAGFVAALDSVLAEVAEAVEGARPAEHVLRHRTDRLAAGRNGFSAPSAATATPTAETEKQFLETQVGTMQSQLNEVKKRLANLRPKRYEREHRLQTNRRHPKRAHQAREDADPTCVLRRMPGRAEVFPEYAAGLRDLEGFSHIYLIYHIHKADALRLVVKPFLQDVERGVFATRAPCRPNPIGLSIVKLRAREGHSSPGWRRCARLALHCSTSSPTRPGSTASRAHATAGRTKWMKRLLDFEGDANCEIAVASGKGGTGKTTVATNLAQVAAADGRAVAYLDCDVEEPNGHLFLKPTIERQQPINKLLPIVDLDRCTFCGRCSQVCRYGAIACVNKQVLVFAELCHSCGGCVLACPADAMREVPKPIGELRLGTAGPIRFIEGRLNVGEAMSPPAIRAVKAASTKWT